MSILGRIALIITAPIWFTLFMLVGFLLLLAVYGMEITRWIRTGKSKPHGRFERWVFEEWLSLL